MKYMVFIIVSFLIFFKTIAFKAFDQCGRDGTNFDATSGIKFLSNHQVELLLTGLHSKKNPGNFPCCVQQGPMIISNYTFFNRNNSHIYTIIPEHKRLWVNGYTRTDILNANDCSSGNFDCNSLYQGSNSYTRADNYDPKKFFQPGENIVVEITIYSHCFHHLETVCLTTCGYIGGLIYTPPQ
ncbi:uncharacterized protein OCT59_005956 [Rhizophagus irregularis]|uniref:uncharacterized protein n=1 Tax=Rhizophagus irregularis TaxID=588596 RepID=UPI0019FFB0EF|nr:hypothetical protein OCT59_005956 [Rhizophagus irregularis]GET64088.1 hypothetical protein GLOIN_2v829924 [Rhizophagus irregularis DAOM 181602=DAOM 197198]